MIYIILYINYTSRKKKRQKKSKEVITKADGS